MFRYFRDPQLTFWVVVVAALAALTIIATQIGTAPAVARPVSATNLVAGATVSSARTQVQALTSLMPAGIAAGTDPAALASFADALSAQASAGNTVRAAEGADATDQMRVGFIRIGQMATQLRAAAADPVAATSLRVQLGLEVTHLNSLVMGLPSPELPGAAGNPLGLGADLVMPVVPSIAAPTVTRKPVTPGGK